MNDAAPRAKHASGFNHVARRAYAPSEYRPTTRVQRRVMENHNRRAYWCHLCCTSRLDSKGLDHHYNQAHPAQVRDESSRMYAMYNDSRHGRLDGQRHAERLSPTDGFPTLRYDGSKRDRPAAQLRPARSQYASASAVALIPLLLQPPPSPLTLPGYHTVKSLACPPPRRAGTEMLPMSPDSPSRKRRRLSHSNTRHINWAFRGRGNRDCFGDRTSEDGDEDGNGNIPHEPSSVSMWDRLGMGRMNAQPSLNPNARIANADTDELSPNTTRALEAGAAYEGEAQDRSASYIGVDIDGNGGGDGDVDVDAATPTEAASRGVEPSGMEVLVRRMFVKQAELRDLMVEMMELVNGSRSSVA